LYEAFEALLLDEEAFRDELAKYAGFDEDGKPLLEPRQVLAHQRRNLPWLKPTARNKMFNAVVMSRASAGAFHQLSSVPERGKKEHQANLDDVFLPLLRKATHDATLPYPDGDDEKEQQAKVGLVSAAEFLEYFDQLHWHPDYLSVIRPLRSFLATATENKCITDWAIVWPQRQESGRMLRFEELGTDAPIWKRARRQSPRIDFTGENKRNILAASAVPAGEDVPVLGKSTTRGVLVISLVADQVESSEAAPVDRADVVGLISLRVPDKSVRSKRELIQWTVVVSEQSDDAVVDVEQS
jgi:hypothetical protein